CDCHIHVYDAKFPVAADAKLFPADASIAQYRDLQRCLGLERAVLVTPSTYGVDNRSMLAGLKELGNQGRGVAVIAGNESDRELGALHAAGVRGVRLTLSLGVVGSIDELGDLAHRISGLGWHLQLLMPPERLGEQGERLQRLAVPIVFDHLARVPPESVHRSEEHTSELQSRENLVCRLLLEKKK